MKIPLSDRALHILFLPPLLLQYSAVRSSQRDQIWQIRHQPTATDGNHGRAVARTARLLGLAAHILVPEGTAAARIDAIASEGAQVDVVDGTYDDAIAASAALASDSALVSSDSASWEKLCVSMEMG